MTSSRSAPASVAVALLALAAGCGEADPGPQGSAPAASPLAGGQPSDMAAHCTPAFGGISLAPGFCAIVVHDGVGPARHLDVAPNGDVFVALRNGRDGGQRGGVVALRDSDGDGVADTEERWGDNGGTDLLLHDGHLYFAPDDAVLRYPLDEGSLTPSGPPDTIVSGLPADLNHTSKSIAIGSDGALFVNVGSPSNACMEQARTAGSPGKDPCDELTARAGIWRFDAARSGQRQADGTRWATGLRNTLALAINPADGRLYGAVHGRDQLHTFAAEHFTEAESSQNPAEEFVLVEEGSDFGWPYCFHRYDTQSKVLGPEYGGDGAEVGRCADKDLPLVAFPGHWAPNDLEFNSGDQFPDSYDGAAFIAFHGSWNRTPTQQGYRVVAVPMGPDGPTGGWTDLAEGFAGGEIASPADAAFRPVGVSMGPDGSLYVSDSVRGRIWRIVFQGDASP